MNFFKPTPPYNRKLERYIGWVILILVCLAVPYTHGALQYCGLLLVGLLLVVLNHAIVSKKTSTIGTTSGAAES
jgi:uncharacterized membrane protein YccC